MPALAIGLFVGGRGTRFGGVAKGNLKLPDGVRLIERLLRVCDSVLPDAPVVLVGQHAEYHRLALAELRDTPAGIGPLGGLRALLDFAAERRLAAALALACDLPYVTPELLRRIAEEAPDALALAPREHGLFYPLTARYSVRALPAVDDAILAREHSLQKLFARLGDRAGSLSLDDAELRSLRDWDSPEDRAS
ncbi:MAG TPA: NTP transferase domain-containing protein [Polyangiaceae bacterium]|nr:NTP transferase domain-containing protein [Polyangiaceae bacterium]